MTVRILSMEIHNCAGCLFAKVVDGSWVCKDHDGRKVKNIAKIPDFCTLPEKEKK